MSFVKSTLKFVAGLAALVAATVAVTLFAARFADGPWAIISGGSFTSGQLVTEEPDWTFIKDRQEVEFELVSTGRSRVTWIAEAQGRIFIPSGYMNSTVGKIWKQWPIHAEQDGRAILRVDDDLYHRTLVRIKDDPALAQVRSELARKYLGGGEVPESEITSNNLWIFEMVKR